MFYYRPEAQALANLLPDDFRLRVDPFSVGQQFLHGSAIHLEHLKKQIKTLSDGCFLGTAHLNALDVIYSIYLGADFKFQADISDPRQISFRVPFIRGIKDGTVYQIRVLPDNSLEALEEALPSRVSSDRSLTLGEAVLSATAVAELGNASLNPPPVPGYLYVTLSGATQKGVMHDGQLLPAGLHLKGITTKGTVEEEIIQFPANLTVRTRKRYQKLLSLRPLNIEPNTATIALSSAEHDFVHHIDLDLTVPVGRREQFVIWTLAGGILTASYAAPGSEKDVVLTPYLSWQLLDDLENPLSGQAALTIIPHRPWLAVVDQDKLFFYHKLLEYPSQERLALLNQRAGSSLVVVESDRFFYLPNDTMEVRALGTAPLRQALRYRWEVAPPGQPFAAYKPDADLNLAPASPGESAWLGVGEELLPVYYKLALGAPGYWGLALTATYADGSTSTDVRLAGALQKTPLAALDLSSLLTGVDNVFVDGDERLWVAAGTEARRLRFATDAALVDYDNNLVFLKEPYDEIEVIP